MTEAIEDIRQKLSDFQSKKKTLKEEVVALKRKIDEGEKMFGNLEECRSLIQMASNETQNLLKSDIENIVTSALEAIPFAESYEFGVNFISRRNSTECDLVFKRGDNEMFPLDSCGYGAADIASFALRIAYWKLHGGLRNTIILDEPFSNLSKEKHPFAIEMVKRISSDLGVQFIISSHEQSIIDSADKLFKMELIDGESIVAEQD
jgi:DNA repair exonuclease SbcCD ATPase subunit